MDVNKLVPEAALEFAVEKVYKIIKLLVIIIIVLIVALIGTNVAWIVYESQYEDVVTTQTVKQDADNGVNNFIGGDSYGFTDSDNDN